MIPLNLKANTGRCSPLSLGENSAIPDVSTPEGMVAVIAYTRPPLIDRSCCGGDDGEDAPRPYFTTSTE